MDEGSSDPKEIVGVLPAAGRALRLGPLPCSKEILPLGIVVDEDGRSRVRVAIEDALDAFVAAGIRRVMIVLAPGKGDIRDFLGEDAGRGLALSYHSLADSPGAAWSVDAAREWAGAADTALAFPDICFLPTHALSALAAARSRASADVWLALVPSTQGEKVDLVRTDPDGQVIAIDIKPGPGHAGWTWVTALWRPRFADFLRARIADAEPGGPERHIGDFINDALDAGYVVRSVGFPEGSARDIGTLDDLRRAWGDGNGV